MINGVTKFSFESTNSCCACSSDITVIGCFIMLALIVIALIVCATILIKTHMDNNSNGRLHNERRLDALCYCKKCCCKTNRCKALIFKNKGRQK